MYPPAPTDKERLAGRNPKRLSTRKEGAGDPAHTPQKKDGGDRHTAGAFWGVPAQRPCLSRRDGGYHPPFFAGHPWLGGSCPVFNFLSRAMSCRTL